MAERIMMTPQELNDGATFLRQRLDAINQEVSQLKCKRSEERRVGKECRL